jgi:hypothetical protein
MKMLFISLLLLGLGSCAHKHPEATNLLRRTIPLIQGNEYWLSLALLDFAELLAKQGSYEECREVASEIQNYRRALALLAVPEAMVEKGQFDQARKVLLGMGELPRFGVGPQASEIVSRMMGCAEAAACSQEVLQALLANNIQQAKVYQRALDSLASEPFSTEKESRRDLSMKSKNSPLNGKASGSLPANRQEAEAPGATPENILVQRMAFSSGSRALVMRLKGLLEAKRVSEAHQLLDHTLLVSPPYRFADLGSEAKVHRLAWRSGWDKQPGQGLESLRAKALAVSAGLETGYAYVGEVIILAAEMNETATAQELLSQAESKAEELPPFFRTMALADLARAAQQSGLPQEGARLLVKSVRLSGENPNPRSQALGVFWAGLAAAECSPQIRGEWEELAEKILIKLPEEYQRLNERFRNTPSGDE